VAGFFRRDAAPSASAGTAAGAGAWLVVGLGNPGPQYAGNRHNVGAMVAELLAAKFAGGWLLKPMTFMNDSGRSAAALAHFYKIAPGETLVVHDDVDLPLGGLRVRLAGSAAGHNGLKSLIRHFGTEAFPRLKVGIAAGAGRPAGGRLVGHVLGGFRPEEQTEIQIAVQRAADAVILALRSGLGAAMNLFNQKTNANPPPQTPR